MITPEVPQRDTKASKQLINEELNQIAPQKAKTKAQLANELLALNNRKVEIGNRRLELDNQRREADNRLRLVIARGVFGVVLLWLLGVFALLVWHMVAGLSRPSDAVLIALLVTTTVNVLGLLSAVVV